MTKTPSYDELMKRKDAVIKAEHDGNLYIKLPSTDYYDNAMWVVNKAKRTVVYMMFTEFLYSGLVDRVRYIIKPKDWPV